MRFSAPIVPPLARLMPRTPLARRGVIGVLAFVILLTVLALFAWLAGPPIARSWVATLVGNEIGRKVEFGEVRINPLRLTADIENVVIHETDGQQPLLRLGAAHVNLSLASIFRLAPVLEELRIERPRLRIDRVEETRFNFSDILDKLAEKPESDPARFSLNNIRVNQGELHYHDRVVDSRNLISEINFSLPFISNLPYAAEIFTEPSLSLKIDGAPLKLDGNSLPFAPSRQTALNINLDGLNLPTYSPFVPAQFKGKVAEALLDTHLEVNFEQQGDAQNIVLNGSAGIRQARIQDASANNAAQWEQLSLSFDRATPLGDTFRIKEIRLDAPRFNVARLPDGQINLALLMGPRSQAAATSTPTASAPTQPAAQAATPSAAAPQSATVRTRKVIIDQITLNKGQVDIEDAMPSATEPMRLGLRELDFSLTGFSTHGTEPASIKIAFKSDDGATFAHEGTLRFAAGTAAGKLNLADWRPQRFAPYYAAQFGGRLGETRADAQLAFDASWNNGVQLRLTDSSARLRDLEVSLPQGKQTPPLRAKLIALEGVQFDLQAQQLAAQGLTLQDASLAATRQANGRFDLQDLLPTRSADIAPAAPAATTSPPTKPWQATLKTLSVDQTQVRFTDATLNTHTGGQAGQLQWRNLKVKLENLAYPLPAKPSGTAARDAWPFELSLNDATTGRVVLSGRLAPTSRSADLKIDLQNYDVAPYQPWLGQLFNAALLSGAISAKGQFTVNVADQQAPRITYAGSLGLANLRTVDKISSEEFVRWRSLELPNIDARFNTDKQAPVRLNLGNVALSDFFARVILYADGRLNLADILAKPGDASAGVSLTQAPSSTPPARANPPTAQVETGGEGVVSTPSQSGSGPSRAVVRSNVASGPAPVIHLGQVTLQKGNVNFSDLFVRPNYTTNLTDLNGSVSAVTSDNPKPARVSIQGRVDNDAPVNIAGELNPFGTQLFLDLTAEAKGIELTRLTPYATKYAGYPITKGKLSLDLKYLIKEGQLQASNRLFLDQLTFGAKVESPDATKLPVLLAVALLQNSRGEIDINLPVSGSLSDPQFSIGGVIVRVIVNLLTKAIVAPFSLLASAFGGNETEMSYVEFGAGSAAMGSAQVERLETLAKALNDRPGLKLDIAGRINPEADLAGLKRASVQRKVRAAKLQEMIAKGAGGNPAEITVREAEYAGLLQKVYLAEAFAKPRDKDGKPLPQTVADMEKQLIENARIGETELRDLAERRALAVKRHLEERGKIGNERMFLVAPVLSAEGITDKGDASRVQFSMRS